MLLSDKYIEDVFIPQDKYFPSCEAGVLLIQS